ncbi:MAG: DUF948 domain-containing protein [Bacillota bacterium]|nr:DUF948 domain-containing protein [Bacillota bacterium]MDW7684845.1 DUF948 domain-containing protein [Bacillota bacterium]
MYISLQDIGVFLVMFVLFIAGIFLIMTLININKLVLGVNRKMSENEKNIQEIINNVSGSTKNVNELTGSLQKNKIIFDEQIPGSINNIYAITTTLKNTGEKVDHSLDIVNSSLVETASTVKDNTQDILSYMRILGEGIRMILEMFTKK